MTITTIHLLNSFQKSCETETLLSLTVNPHSPLPPALDNHSPKYFVVVLHSINLIAFIYCLFTYWFYLSNSRHLFLTVLEHGKSKIEALIDQMSWEGNLLICKWPSLLTSSHDEEQRRRGFVFYSPPYPALWRYDLQPKIFCVKEYNLMNQLSWIYTETHLLSFNQVAIFSCQISWYVF